MSVIGVGELGYGGTAAAAGFAEDLDARRRAACLAGFFAIVVGVEILRGVCVVGLFVMGVEVEPLIKFVELTHFCKTMVCHSYSNT